MVVHSISSSSIESQSSPLALRLGRCYFISDSLSVFDREMPRFLFKVLESKMFILLLVIKEINALSTP